MLHQWSNLLLRRLKRTYHLMIKAQILNKEKTVLFAVNGRKVHPNWKPFPFNEIPGIKLNVPDAGPLFFFELMLTDDLVEDLVKKSNEYTNKSFNRNRPLRRRFTWNSWKEVAIVKWGSLLGYPLSTYAKFSEKLTKNVRVRIRG